MKLIAWVIIIIIITTFPQNVGLARIKCQKRKEIQTRDTKKSGKSADRVEIQKSLYALIRPQISKLPKVTI